MDLNRLKQVIAAFADDPASLIMEKGRLVVQIQGELIEATTSMEDGQILVCENGSAPIPAARWVATRIAQLDYLADRLCGLFPLNEKFVVPRGTLLDRIDDSPGEEVKVTDDAVNAATSFLQRRPGGVSSVLYLTSDAGEGKTTLIARLAHQQAKAYLARTSNWLLVPFSLGGNAFLRFDNVIAAGLLNQLRIRRFYIDGFLHLVRLGYLVPALDGFEEVFVEGAGEAVSSLGTLIRDLRGEGTMLVAARTAYFEFKRLDSQARLFDTVSGEYEVGFGKLALSPWGEKEFVRYGELSELSDPADVYNGLAERLGAGHALLTRAFFVNRIVELAKSSDGLAFLRQLQPKVQDNFKPFISKILEREVREKWVDKHSQPAVPLLSLEEHHDLLKLLAEEMWMSKRGSLPKATCEDLADLYCEERRKSPVVSRQVRERLPDHALLTLDAGSQLAFDHDHFREFFLGEQLGNYMSARAIPDIKKLLRIDSIPTWTLDSAVSCASAGGRSIGLLLEGIIEVASSEGPASFVRENCGGLCVRLCEKLEGASARIPIKGMTLPLDALAGRGLAGMKFSNCYFRSTTVSGVLTNVTFANCEFEHIEVAHDFDFGSSSFEDSTIHGLTVTRGEQSVDYYDPQTIETYLSRTGAAISKQSQAILIAGDLPQDDDEIKIVRKLIQIFRRSTQVSESVITLRLGVHVGMFFNEMCSRLLEAGILRPVKNRGGGNQRRFRLGRSMAVISQSLAASKGAFDAFLLLAAAGPEQEAVSDVEDDE